MMKWTWFGLWFNPEFLLSSTSLFFRWVVINNQVQQVLNVMLSANCNCSPSLWIGLEPDGTGGNYLKCICSSCVSSCSFQGKQPTGVLFLTWFAKSYFALTSSMGCRILLWAPFVNVRKFPRDPSLKYPWSVPENPSLIKGGFKKFPWATPEDYD